MNTIDLDLTIELSPDHMNSSINEVLFEKLKEKHEGTCTKKNGYIIEILEINKINKNIINDYGNIFFNITCKTKILKPNIGDVLDFSVNMIFNHGIFANLNNLKVLIPNSSLESIYEYEDSNKVYISKNEGSDININDNISVEITDLRYLNKNYSCIGALKT